MKIIVVGAGVVGYSIARRLSDEGHDVIIIEKDERVVRSLQENLDVKIIKGSGSSPGVLIEAGIEHSDMVIAVTNSDEVNMVACLIAGSQSMVPKKIARIRDLDYLSYTKIFEQDYLDLDLNINPELVTAERINKIIEIPGAVDVIDFFDGGLKLIGSRLTVDSPVVGKRVRDLKDFHPDHSVILVAIYRAGETIIPQGSTMLKADDLLFAVTLPGETRHILTMLGKGERSGRRVLIVGGGDIGYYLAEHLEGKGYKVKIIERREDRCALLAERLNKTIVINGDGTDQALLAEENIFDVDTFVAVTDDEEVNILTSLLTKRLGVGRSMALVDKSEYISMVSTVGIDVAISPRLTSVSSILRFIRRGNILSVTTLLEERVEAIEVVAMETSEITGRPIKNMRLPREVVIGAIVKDDKVTIPVGDTVIHPGDKVILFALPRFVPKLEKLLMVKPEFF